MDSARHRRTRKARLLGLILPQAEREELVRRFGSEARPALLSAAVGVFEMILGIAVYVLGHPGFGGAFGWVVWHLNPITWLGILAVFTGLGRVANYLANRDSFGEPLVWLFLRIRKMKQRADDQRTVRESFGPERPDRVVVEGNGTFVLLASRAKPDWDEYNTVRIEDRFFKIDAVEERAAGRYRATAYVLDEIPESEVLRGIVHTDAKLPREARSS